MPAFFLTFDLLLLNEFPDQEADRHGGRANLIHRFGRERAASIYVVAALAVPVSIVAAVGLDFFPAITLVGLVPSVLLVRPVSWATERPETAVSIDTLRDNVIWVLATNFLLALGFFLATPASRPLPTTSFSIYDSAFLAGRLLFGGAIAVMAINNFVDLENVSEKIGEKGVAQPKVAVIATSAPLLFAAVSIITGLYPTVGASYIVLFMVGSTIVVHNFWSVEDPDEQDNEAFHFFKNVAILSGALLLLASSASEWPYALGVYVP